MGFFIESCTDEAILEHLSNPIYGAVLRLLVIKANQYLNGLFSLK